MKALIFNSGSSSLKFSLFDAESELRIADGSIDWTNEPAWLVLTAKERPAARKQLTLRGHADAIACIVEELCSGADAVIGESDQIKAVGHRVVHGGERYTSAVRITVDAEQAIAELADLAPLHNPASLEAIRVARKCLPNAMHVAAFDTAFHSTLPAAARTYAVPRQWTEDWHIRRYGFHGLSHSYCAVRAAEMLPGRASRLIICHLGNGASISAVNDGICIDTSMGFTPLDGLMMGTRSGCVDPGILIYLLRHTGMSADEIDHALNYESGLLGISGISSDMRAVLAASNDNAQAHLAVDVYVHCLVKGIGAMAATLCGVDALIFTAGIGEHSPEIRQRVCQKLAFLGLELDGKANAECRPDVDIAARGSKGRILAITTREDLAIIREIRRLIHLPDSRGVHS